MTNDEIIKKACKKAMTNGWKHEVYYDDGYPYYMIWQHDFAQALWPDPPYYNKNVPSWGEPQPYWKHHITKMVLADDPIKYLGDNIDLS